MNRHTVAFGLVLLAAAVLRVLRMHVRWDEITLAYAAYAEPLAVAVSDGHPSALLGSWVGLHPPAWGVVQAVLETVAPIPWAWMGFSAACSLAAVWVVGRAGGIAAALVLATAPVHLLDAAEVNNYPMASLAIALLMVSARGPWPLLAAAAVFAAWSHLLAGVGAVVVVGWRLVHLRGADARRLVAAVGLGVMPIAGGATRLMGQGSTWAQPDVDWAAWLDLLTSTVGLEGLLLIPIVVWGLRGPLAWGWGSMAVGLLALVALGAAAAHQRPYYGLIAPIAALAVGQAVSRKPALLWLVIGLTTVRGARFGIDDAQRVQSIVHDLQRTRAVDVALAEAKDGDSIWLVSPALQTDDDKSAHSPVLWRFRPWHAASLARPVPFEYKDYRYGQPRDLGGVVLHTSTELESASFDHVASEVLERDGTLWVVLYDYAPATGMVGRVTRVLKPYAAEWAEVGEDVGLGADQLIRVEGWQ
ncbi:MAG: hypothetical protein VX944_03755 [Myxococcota bacterium]|nr:hypothetical protein [Myxococcota bacterium]